MLAPDVLWNVHTHVDACSYIECVVLVLCFCVLSQYSIACVLRCAYVAMSYGHVRTHISDVLCVRATRVARQLFEQHNMACDARRASTDLRACAVTSLSGSTVTLGMTLFLATTSLGVTPIICTFTDAHTGMPLTDATHISSSPRHSYLQCCSMP